MNLKLCSLTLVLCCTIQPSTAKEKPNIIFTSDNGPLFFDSFLDQSGEDANGHDPAGGIRGGKYNVFEGVCRVLFIASWPGHIAPSVSSDIYATFASIAGTTVKSGSARDSIEHSPNWLGNESSTIRDS